MRAESIILEPVLTEKSNEMREGEQRKYVFKVDPSSNKNQIRQAVKELFSVKPVKCTIINVKKKPRASRSRSGMRVGHTTPWKKAIVTLAPGDKIDMIDGV
jgi:large subunit ribosomal protein L23